MTTDVPRSLRDHLTAALDAADPTLAGRLESDPAAFLDLVALARDARNESGRLLQAAVDAARGAGCTWEQIGAVLGTSRQGAQQRHGGSDATADAITDAPVDDAAPERWELRPLTAFNEMHVLDRAGRYGWHTVGYGVAFHLVERDSVQWEHARTTFGAQPYGTGWQRVGAGWALWTYWARPLGTPALPGNPTVSDLLRG